MTAGAKDKKKLMFLAGLGALLAIVMYENLFSGPSVPAAVPDRPAAAVANSSPGLPVAVPGSPGPRSTPRPRTRTRNDEFNPPYLANRLEDRPDVTKIDPTLRLDLFAKVQDVDAAGGQRNLFAFGQPPPPPKPPETLTGKETKVALGPQNGGPGAAGVQAHPAPASELPVRSNLRYYGIVSIAQGGQKTACFLDTGEEILLATEGDTLKRRFRVMKIGTASVILQDTESKREETIPLTAEAKGS